MTPQCPILLQRPESPPRRDSLASLFPSEEEERKGVCGGSVTLGNRLKLGERRPAAPRGLRHGVGGQDRRVKQAAMGRVFQSPGQGTSCQPVKMPVTPVRSHVGPSCIEAAGGAHLRAHTVTWCHLPQVLRRQGQQRLSRVAMRFPPAFGPCTTS
jgi:hypothetical protein